MKFSNTTLFGWILNLLLPGLGHVFFREYLFGVFVFLVTLIAVILFTISFFLSLPWWAAVIMFGLPLIFYLFTFADLAKTIRSKKPVKIRATSTVSMFLIIGVVYQLLAPVAPGNFIIRNRPEYFVLEDNRLSPVYHKGDLLKASQLAYSVDVYFIDRPMLHALPQRYDIVRFRTASGQLKNAIVLGLPGETIQAAEGVVVVDGMPDFNSPPGGMILQGDCPLTSVDRYSILVAVLNLGFIEQVIEVRLDEITGKVDKVF